MNTTHRSWLLATLLGTTLYVPTAQAQEAPPAECSQRNLSRVYQNAYSRGQDAVDKALRSVGDSCTEVDALQAALFDRLAQWIPQTGNGRDTPACIAKGLTAGIYDGLAQLEELCFGVCIIDGRFLGELAGTLYCELSLRFSGLALPDLLPSPATTPCGERFEAACFESYRETTQSYVAERGRSCSPYLQGDFQTVWSSTGDGQCLYLDDE